MYFNSKGIKKFTKYCEAVWDHKKDGCLGVDFVNKLNPKNVGR
jgi:hypothetical protein